MERRRYHDPLGVSENPNITCDPVLLAEIQAEMMRKLEYLDAHHRAMKAFGLDRESFNRDVDRLRDFVRHPERFGPPTTQLNPWLAMAINAKARKLAGLPRNAFLGVTDKDFLVEAFFSVGRRVKKLRGTPGQVHVREYVEGAMAILHEATGRPVMSHKELDYDYIPNVSGENGLTLRMLVDNIEPGISDTKLAFWVRETRKKYAGKHMRFRDLFPGYGSTRDARTGAPIPPAGYRLTAFTPVSPIYCP